MFRKVMCLAAVFMLIALITVTTAEARPKLEVRVGGGLRFGGSFSEGAYHRTDYPGDFQDDVYFEQLDIAPGKQFAVNFYVPLRPPGPNGEALKFELFVNLASSDLRFDPQSQFPDSVSEQFEKDGDKLVLGEVDVMYVHGGVVYQFGKKAGWNPHVNLGLGATIFSATDGDMEESKFSLSLGGGVTRMFNETIGTRLQLRGYFTSLPAEEFWMDRYGYVWEVTDANWFFQGELSGGIVIAF
jgi:hypothetical protein